MKPTLLKKLSVSLLSILLGAGTLFFYDVFKNFTPEKASQILWVTLFGLGFAYVLNYKLEIPAKNNEKK